MELGCRNQIAVLRVESVTVSLLDFPGRLINSVITINVALLLPFRSDQRFMAHFAFVPLLNG